MCVHVLRGLQRHAIMPAACPRYAVPVPSLPSPCLIPRFASQVHIQGGQCGNQIGAKFWEVISDGTCASW